MSGSAPPPVDVLAVAQRLVDGAARAWFRGGGPAEEWGRAEDDLMAAIALVDDLRRGGVWP